MKLGALTAEIRGEHGRNTVDFSARGAASFRPTYSSLTKTMGGSYTVTIVAELPDLPSAWQRTEGNAGMKSA